MGLLDDAIREHLDLQRRRGADPAEIERLEREALGPVRREPAAAAPDEPVRAPAAAAPAPRLDDDFLDEHDEEWDRVHQAEPDDEFYDEDATSVLPTAGTPRDVPVAQPPLHDEPPLEHEPAAYDDPFADDEPLRAGDPLAGEPHAQPPAYEAAPLEPAEPDPIEEPRSGGARPGGIASPDYADPEFDRHTSKHRLPRLFGRRHEEPPESEPQPEPPAVRRIDSSTPRDQPGLASSADQPLKAPIAHQSLRRDEPEPQGGEGQRPPSLQISGGSGLDHTVEYDVEQAFREEDGVAGDEDILEETPDFLADTPDHDRLWFEQKPPPDFDFDA